MAEKLERPDSPLEEALKFLRPLQQLVASKLSTHALAFEIYWRRGRPLLMLQSVKRAIKVLGGLNFDIKHHCPAVGNRNFISLFLFFHYFDIPGA